MLLNSAGCAWRRLRLNILVHLLAEMG